MTPYHAKALALWHEQQTDKQIAWEVGVSSEAIRHWRYRFDLAANRTPRL